MHTPPTPPPPPPSYEREIQHYKLANCECMQRAIANYDWDKVSYNIDINKKVLLFDETVLNIIRNFILYETIIFDDRDPPWITSRIKEAFQDKNLAFKRFVKNKGSVNNSSNLERFRSLQKNLSSLTETSKHGCFSKIAKKLPDPNTSSQTYWSILKRFLTSKEVPCIPPIFHDNKFITDFREKAELFNSFFTNQCSLITNTSELLTNCESLTDKSLSNIFFTDNDIGKIIKGLDPNKAHGHDMMIMVAHCCHLQFESST